MVAMATPHHDGFGPCRKHVLGVLLLLACIWIPTWIPLYGPSIWTLYMDPYMDPFIWIPVWPSR